MKRIFVPTTDGTDWQPLLAKPILHWKKGASAMTAAAAWEASADQLPPEIGRALSDTGRAELSELELLAAFPEWQVSLPGGTTKSSTDIMAICRNQIGLCVVAVEAKVLEDFGPTVGEKRKAASDGQNERLDYLHRLLGVGRFDDTIRYQLLHRTASAILTAQAFHAKAAVMMVQAFDTPGERRSDFTAFCEAVHAKQITSDIYEASGGSGITTYLGWCDGDVKYRSSELSSKYR